jgi:hypothetical protein
MRSATLYLGVGIILGTHLARSETVVQNERIGNAVQRSVLIPSESFNKIFLTALCKKFIADEKAPLAKLIVATTEADLLTMLGHKATHTVYQSWYPEYVRERSSSGPAAELIVVNGRATLRIQDQSRSVTTVTLAGGDALKFYADGIEFHLLDFSARTLPGPVAGVAPQGQVFEFYFCSRSSFTTDSVRLMTLQIMTRLGLTGVTVAVRDDTWFVEEPTFPTYYRFAPSDIAPTIKQYSGGHQATCLSIGDSRVQCH